MTWINVALVWLCDLLLQPLLRLPPVAGLLVVSLMTAAVMLPVIARTSNQKRMAETKRRIHAALLEIRLFNDDPRAVLRALGDALRFNGLYLRLSLVPLAWMAIPLALLMVHLHSFYGYAGLEPNVPALVKVQLRDVAGRRDGEADVALTAPAAVRVETGAVRLSSSSEVLWRIVPTAPGDYALTIRAGDDTVTKTLHVSDRPARRSPTRVSAGFVEQLLSPSEPPLDESSSIVAIAVTYPEAEIDVFGWHVHWVIVYGVLSMICALVLARRFGVTI